MSVARSWIAGAYAVPWPVGFALVLCLAAGLRLSPPVDWEGGDAENYACIAWRLAGGESVVGRYSGPPHEPDEAIGPRAFAIRPAVTVPAAWLLAALPPRPWAFAAWPLVLGLSEVALAMLLGRRWWGPRAGLLAGLLLACLPLAVSEARALRADLPAAVFLGWGVFALWAGMDGRTAATRASLGLVAGAAFGMSWLAKETITLAVPALAAIAAIGIARYGRTAWPALVAAGLAGLSVLAAESATYASAVGDPLFRFHELARNFEQCRENFFYADSPAHGWPEGGYGAAVLERLAIAGPAQILFSRPSLGIGFLGLVAGLALARRGDGARAPALAWLALLALAFNFGSTSLAEYRPVVPASTYFYPLVLPACLLCGAAAAAWHGHRIVRVMFALFITAAGVTALAVNARDLGPTARLRALAGEVPEGSRVAIDFRGTTAWSYLTGGAPHIDPGVVAFEAVTGPDEVDFVVVREGVLGFLRDNYRYGPPAWVARLGDGERAEEIIRTGNERLFRIRREGDRP